MIRAIVASRPGGAGCAGAGGVVQLVIQLLKSRSARVIATVSSEEKRYVPTKPGLTGPSPARGLCSA